MSKRVWSGFFVLGLLVLAGVILSWWLAPRWLPSLAENLARKAGAELLDLEVGRPGWRGWRIDSLRLRTGEFEFSATAIDISWLCCRQLENSFVARVDRLTINQHQQDLVAEQATSPLALTFVLNSLAQRMPFKELTVAELIGMEQQPAPLSLQIRKNREQLEVDLRVNALEANTEFSSAFAGAANKSFAEDSSLLVYPSDSTTQHHPGLLLAQISWQSPGNLLLRISFDGSVVNLQGQLDDKGFWNWAGRYRLQFLRVTDLLAAWLPGRTIPDLRSAGGFDVDQLNMSGQLTAAVPDVFGFSEWQLQLNNSMDAHLVTPVAMSLNSQLSLMASGIKRVRKLTLDTPRLIGFLEKDLPWQYLPRSWQLAATEPINCRFNDDSGTLMTADQTPGLMAEAGLPINSDDKSTGDVQVKDAIGAGDCLQSFTLSLRSLAADNAPMNVEISSFVDLTAIEEFVPVNFDARARFNVNGLPERVTLGGELGWNPDRATLQGLSPLKITWQGLLLGQKTSASGEIYAENVSVNSQQAGHWQLATDLMGAVKLHIKQQELMTNIWATARLNAREIYVTAGEVKAARLTLPFEFKWKITDNNGWLSLKSAGEVADIIDQTGILDHLDIPLDIAPGILETTSFFHFQRSDSFVFKGRTQFLLDNWMVNWHKENNQSLKLNNLVLRGDVQFDQTDLKIINPLWVQIGSADVGIPLQKISVKINGKVRWQEGLVCRLEISQAQLRVLDGEARILEPASVRCPLGAFSVPVAISGIDLGKLVAIESDKVVATGELAGQLPVRFIDGQILLEDGRVAAQGPGNIRLADPEYWRTLASGDGRLALALGILENFNYDELSIGVDLDKNGLLLMNTRFRGRNPELKRPGYQGQVVELNLNIENNIVQLLKSASLPTAIEQRIDRAFE